MKKFISVFISIVMLVSVNCGAAHACKLVCDFSEYTGVNAAMRSAFMPGWGQRWNEQKTKGWIVFGLFAASVFGAFYYLNKSEDVYDTYEKLGSRNASYYNDYEDHLNTSRILGITAAVIWAYAVVDAYIVGNKKSQNYVYEKFNVNTYGSDGVMVTYKTRFNI